MQAYTNMAWPDDPYRTGQQLYPRPAPRLAAFATGPSPARGRQAARSAAIVYLPLHRTRALTVTGQTLTFGFRAASITSEAEAGGLAAVADLDLIQARRHAAILTGCMLPSELTGLQMPAGVILRGLAAIQAEWASRRTPGRGRPACSTAQQICRAMNAFCRAWAGTYDAVFYCCDRFSQYQQGDPYRAKVLDLQSAADRVVRSTCASTGQNVIDIPPGMTTSERVRWIAARLANLGITVSPRPAS